MNRMVIRNLKALRDLRVAPLALNVQNFGQLNVGQLQTNVAQPNPMQNPSQGAIVAPSKPRRQRRKSA